MMFFSKAKKLNLLFLLILFLNCSENKPVQQVLTKNNASDSINNWIKESKTPKLMLNQRLKLLSKAHKATTQVKNDSLRASYYTLLSSNYTSTKDSAQFRDINQKSITLNKSINDSLAIAMGYRDLGTFFDSNAVNDSAYYAYSEAQKLFERIGEKRLSGDMFLHMAIIQIGIKDYVGSETTITKAIERFKPLEINFSLFQCYNILGVTMGALGESEKSLAYYNEALHYLKKEPYEKIEEAKIINNIGVVYRNSKQYEKAISNFEKVAEYEDIETSRPDFYAIALSNLASSKLYNRDTLGINTLFLKAIDIKRNNNQNASLAGTYFNYAEYKAYAQDTLAAIEMAEKAEDLSLLSENNERLLETWVILANLDQTNASLYFDKYINLDNRLQSEERKQQNKFARIRFETDEFIAQNVVLESEKELLSKQKQMWAGIAAVFFLLGLSIYTIINQRAKNQKLRFDQQQQANNQEIFNLMLMQKQKVDEVKRMEQKRISEELHDGILGKMLGARMVLIGLNKRATEEAIQEKSKALSSLQEIENEIRSISHELSHTAYQKINNFTDSIESLLTCNSKNTDIETFFNYNEDEDWDCLPGDIKINVYRIIQETLQNTMKHANCTLFNITFEISETYFNVIMGDNGSGFNTNKEKKGIGMRNISSRMHKLSGSWHIESIKTKGTTISLKIPIKKSANFDDVKKQIENV